jgi:redox-sensitive bicupin YhaK (pirin superfamily)
VIDGELTHQDSMGTKEALGRGAVQFMTAGTGVRHSEFNVHKTQPLRFIQSWITPRARGLRPNYGSMEGGNDSPKVDAWGHLVSDTSEAATVTPVKINQDANLYTSLISPGKTLSFPLRSGRQAYVVLLEQAAQVSFGDTPAIDLGHGDAADVVAPTMADSSSLVVTELTFTVAVDAPAPAHVLIWEMAKK